jgi:cytochrome c oxidase subunit IV
MNVHVVPLRVLLTVFVVLLALTFTTVAATWLDFGGWALPIALGIATLKASLVALYFMHLRYDNPFYAVVLLTALLFLAIFLSLTLLDTFQYQPEVENWRLGRNMPNHSVLAKPQAAGAMATLAWPCCGSSWQFTCPRQA